MIIRVTQKLAKKIKVAPAAALPFHKNPFLDWTANIFMCIALAVHHNHKFSLSVFSSHGRKGCFE
jgi:hypothetical protein